MKTPEGKVKDQIKAILQEYGAHFYMPVPTGYGLRGEPDFICCYKGRYVAIEAKASGGTLSPHQKQRLASIQFAGGIALVEWGAADCLATRTVFEGLKGS